MWGDWGAGEEDRCRERRSGGEGTGEGVQGTGRRGQGEFEGTGGGGTSRKCPRGDPGRGQQKQSMNEKDAMKHITLHGKI